MNKEERTSDYVCFPCGREYLTDAQKKKGHVVTAHNGICGLCGKETSITHMRAFNYLNKKLK